MQPALSSTLPVLYALPVSISFRVLVADARRALFAYLQLERTQCVLPVFITFFIMY